MASREANVNFSRLRKGMVFWYNPDPEINKNNVPDKIVDGRTIKDWTMYGERPYVVVSANSVCRLGRIVQICPIGTKSKDNDFPYDVVYNSFSGTGQSVIRCEQIRTVNSAELTEYECMLDDDIMDMVDAKLRELIGLDDVVNEVEVPVISMDASEVEDLIDRKIASITVEVANQCDNAVSRVVNAISAVIQNKFMYHPITPITRNDRSKQVALGKHRRNDGKE